MDFKLDFTAPLISTNKNWNTRWITVNYRLDQIVSCVSEHKWRSSGDRFDFSLSDLSERTVQSVKSADRLEISRVFSPFLWILGPEQPVSPWPQHILYSPHGQRARGVTSPLNWTDPPQSEGAKTGFRVLRWQMWVPLGCQSWELAKFHSKSLFLKHVCFHLKLLLF